MNSPWTIIDELESNNGRLFKEGVVEREAKAGNDEFFKGCRWALDSMITFGVKKVELKDIGTDGKGITAAAFWDLAERLSKRELTGNAALTAINFLRMNATVAEWNSWYRRILIKDLRCGTSESTINKIAEKVNTAYSVPVFTCQLAQDGVKVPKKVKGKKIIEVKLDGMRVLTIVYPNGQVDQYSRNGKELVNFPEVKRQIAKHAIFFKVPTVLDGEIMSANFQDLMKQARRKSDVKTDDAVLNLFDIIPLSEFLAGKGTRAQKQRSADLLAWFAPVEDHMPNVTLVGQEEVDLETDAGKARFKEINASAIAGGYEGIMLKELNDVYECDRTDSWLKIKPFIEVSLTAVAVEEGTGKHAGKMGAVLFEGTDDGKFIRVSCGGGWSDKDREDIWAHKELVIGEVGEIRADAATKSQDNDDVWSLRFPRFKTWRGFVPGEKL
jgi:DNA ligase-1